MKRICFSLLLIVASLCASAQVGDLFAEFRHAPNAEYLHLPRALLSMLKPVVRLSDSDQEARAVLKAIRSVRVLDLEECSPKVKNRFMEAVANFNPGAYTELIRSNQDDERTLILYKMGRHAIRELLIVESSKDDAQIVQVKGRIRPENINDIIDTTNKKKRTE